MACGVFIASCGIFVVIQRPSSWSVWASLLLSPGILVPQPGIELTSLALRGRFFNHWTTREVPVRRVLVSFLHNCGYPALILCQNSTNDTFFFFLIIPYHFLFWPHCAGCGIIVPCVCMCAKLLQSCPTLLDPMVCNLPGSSVMGFFRQEYWKGLPFTPQGDLANPGIKPASPVLQADFLLLSSWGSPLSSWPGIKPVPCAVEVGSLNCWTTREIPTNDIFLKMSCSVESENEFSLLCCVKYSGLSGTWSGSFALAWSCIISHPLFEDASSLSHADLLSRQWKAPPNAPGRMRVGKAIHVTVYRFVPWKIPEGSCGPSRGPLSTLWELLVCSINWMVTDHKAL